MLKRTINRNFYIILGLGFVFFGYSSKDGKGRNILYDANEEVIAADSLITEKSKGVVVEDRFVAIDNVCAWPNLTVLPDGTYIATIFNQPSHARQIGSVECWASVDGGKIWEKRGTPAPHEPSANRMNVAAGLSSNGALIVIASGWSLKPGESPEDPMSLIAILRPWVSRSVDGGKTWNIDQSAFPKAEKGMTEFIPFGDILPGEDGTLRVLAYAQSLDKAINKVSMFKSGDDGKTWEWMSFISEGKGDTKFAGGHNETAFFHTGEGNWIAAARRWKAGMAIDLFHSNNDGKTWELLDQITEERQHPGHVMQLENGNLLLTYGNRKKGEYGVAVKISKDKGNTWGDEQILIDDLSSGDAGYPTSVQLPDGTVMTAYYSNGMPAHQRYHMGTVFWKLP